METKANLNYDEGAQYQKTFFTVIDKYGRVREVKYVYTEYGLFDRNITFTKIKQVLN